MTGEQAARDREVDAEAEILDALVDRGEEGLTVLELRAFVDADIDTIETRLTELKREGLIEVEQSDDAPLIKPDDSVMPDPDDTDDETSILDSIRDRLPF
jgi:ribosome assembly protein YihI (activator of Der GTPase)